MGIVVGVIFISIFIPAMGEVNYNTKEPKLTRIPTVCIYEPNEPKAREPIKEEWMKQTEIGIKSWQYPLMQGEEKDRDKWKIDIVRIPLERQQRFDNEGCSVELRYTDTPNRQHPSWVGWERFDGKKSQIVIFYMDKEICGYKYDPELDESKAFFCYVDEFKRSGQIGNIAAHEFGHTMGLGHYHSSITRQNYYWSSHPESSPSVMTIAIHYNEELNQVKQIDVDKVKEIYQNRGFGQYVPFELKEKESTEIKEPDMEATILRIGPDQRSPFLIEGSIPDELIASGIPVEFQIERSDGITETGQVMATQSGNYQYPFSFDSDLQSYKVIVKYNGKIIDHLDIDIGESNPDSIQTTKKIPEWIKYNVRWWVEGQAEEFAFLDAVRFLANERIIDVSSQVKTALGSNQEYKVPSWLKSNAGWWADGKIPDSEFLNGIQYLVRNGIIAINYEQANLGTT